MLYVALGCLVLALILAVLGLAGNSTVALRIAWVPLLIGLVLLVIPLICRPLPPAP